MLNTLWFFFFGNPAAGDITGSIDVTAAAAGMSAVGNVTAPIHVVPSGAAIRTTPIPAPRRRRRKFQVFAGAAVEAIVGEIVVGAAAAGMEAEGVVSTSSNVVRVRIVIDDAALRREDEDVLILMGAL